MIPDPDNSALFAILRRMVSPLTIDHLIIVCFSPHNSAVIVEVESDPEAPERDVKAELMKVITGTTRADIEL